MTAFPTSSSPLGEAARQELGRIRKNWIWFLVLGILTIVLGVFLIATPLLGSLAAVWMISVLLIAGGIVQFVGAFSTKGWGGFFLSLLAGVLYVGLGVLIVDRPVTALEVLTIVIALSLVIGGLSRIIVAASERFYGWGWTALSGGISLLLGVMIWRQLPTSAFWVIGLFLGIEMLFTGMTWVMLALGLKSLPKPESS
ncbi:HdeD family acid-resistance protein [Tautonia plasticadhaerens]|uniref:Acid-resistance membrane protein n=1 Tax=Tautonia plasticadhaerens TaxID=2527974 RepID=A0A518GV62_9BACT|nr:HdeD family acid-resistance protein [Tautonia plasticadhaerens]QDV32466.1 acid-resistance membrane protein [Tautonia plasticadhaerens]